MAAESYLEVDLGALAPDFKEALSNSFAVAAIEDVIGIDQSEVWTVLGEQEPNDYDYDADEHSNVIEKATAVIATELLEALSGGTADFLEKIDENDGLDKCWTQFKYQTPVDSIDAFNELLQFVLEQLD